MTTTKMTTRGEDHRRGRRRKIIVSDETKDIKAPAEIGMRRWGGRGWALSLLAVAIDRSELPRGRCQRVRLKGLLYPVQTHNKQIHNNQLVLSG
jgi:hypothetical protein